MLVTTLPPFRFPLHLSVIVKNCPTVPVDSWMPQESCPRVLALSDSPFVSTDREKGLVLLLSLLFLPYPPRARCAASSATRCRPDNAWLWLVQFFKWSAPIGQSSLYLSSLRPGPGSWWHSMNTALALHWSPLTTHSLCPAPGWAG